MSCSLSPIHLCLSCDSPSLKPSFLSSRWSLSSKAHSILLSQPSGTHKGSFPSFHLSQAPLPCVNPDRQSPNRASTALISFILPTKFPDQVFLLLLDSSMEWNKSMEWNSRLVGLLAGFGWFGSLFAGWFCSLCITHLLDCWLFSIGFWRILYSYWAMIRSVNATLGQFGTYATLLMCKITCDITH